MSRQNTRVEDNEAAATPASQPKTISVRKRRRFLKVTLVIIAGLLAYGAFDLLAPRSSRMRSFDPEEVARLDTAMWRSYYARQQVKLYNQMTELLRTQYNLPFVRSNTVAYQAARAAFVFKGGHNRQDYEKALPYLVSFYASLHKVSDIPFDVDRAAKLELEWWIIHRERDKHAAGDLEHALADLSGELYQMPAGRFTEYARLRAEAMTIRDTKAEAGVVTEADWARIDELLHESWKSLKDVVTA